jgi:chromosome segregation ATPase
VTDPNSGEGVGKTASPVIDPTKNVLDLVTAAIERQDDLRAGEAKLYDERHENVQREFDNIERRRTEHKSDTKVAVDAAFTAAKEAVREQAAASDKAISKSEATVSGQIKAVEGTVDDLKDRIGKLETQQQTKIETRSDSRSNVGMIVGILGAVFGFLMFVAVVAIAMLRPTG